MIKRIQTGAVITACVYAWLFFSHIPPVLQIGTLTLGVLAVLEIMRIWHTPGKGAYCIAIAATVLLLLCPIPQYEACMILILPMASTFFGFLMVRREQIREFHPALAVAVGIAVVLLFKAFPTLRNSDNGLTYLTFAISACFVTDVSALLFGKALGSHRLCPRISPKKTVEGALGGIGCTVLSALAVGGLLERWGVGQVDWMLLLIWSLLVSVFGQFGDLCMSVVKRIAGVKDFGHLLPGHGGILDRFDSHMFAVAFTLVFCALTGGFIR